MPAGSDVNVRAVERALRIIDCFGDGSAEMGISGIAHKAGLHKATAHRIVSTLVRHRYLERAADGQKYRLGIGLVSLGFVALRRADVRREAMPVMSELAGRLNETCDLSVYNQGEVYFIEVVQGRRALKVAASVGNRLPAHCTASGKLFLASLPEEELEALLRQPLASYTTKTNTSPERLRAEVEATRRRGSAIDDEEMEEGVCAVAAPIRNQTGIVVAAIGMPGPTNRMTPDRIARIAAALLEAADAISQRMGWRAQGPGPGRPLV